MEAITGTLGLNWPGLLWHTINFVVLLLLLRMVLYKPVVSMLDQRAQRVRESMEQAEQARRAAEQAEADRQALLAETRREAEEIRARAEEQSKRIIGEAAGRAQHEANRILAQAKSQTEQERTQMLAEVRAQIADLVVVAVDRVTRHALDASTQRSLVQQFLVSEPATGNGSPNAAR
ncbi:MAG: F0F1 ATP synthase subunit B [Chloroflexota bacterium]|nr:F0F1 ATP synthase subunit B [Chloroflexota bacterium]